MINLAPADIPKNSSSIDLAIALAIMQPDKQFNIKPDHRYVCVGEFGLDGNVKPAKKCNRALKEHLRN